MFNLTKVFDRVSHCGLLIKVYKLNIPVDFTVMFKFWFQHTYGIIYWKGCVSQVLYIRSDVKQVSICSPRLFNVYINDLIIRLKNSRLGYYVFGEYTGCILYGDDIVLLSAFVRQLQVMLSICSQYALDNELIFNNNKLYNMGFGKGIDLTNLPQLFVSRKPIEWVQ